MSQQRLFPLRKPPGFVAPVQRWSARFPVETRSLFVFYCGVQASDENAIANSPFIEWARRASAEPAGPMVCDHTRFVDKAGMLNRVFIGYWSDRARYEAWRSVDWNEPWWSDSARLSEPAGYWRETFEAPLDRQETIFFPDFRAGIGLLPDASLEKNYETGYWGAMRDRIPASAFDPLDGLDYLQRQDVQSRGRRISIQSPPNLAVIRSGQMWERCGDAQREEYFTALKPRLEAGMAYIQGNPEASGCCEMRYMRHCDIDGALRDETSVNSLFLTLSHLERWAESHITHKAIYAEAIKQVLKYKERREMRTWHEVFVLPDHGRLFEYLNCHADTGLLPFFYAAS